MVDGYSSPTKLTGEARQGMQSMGSASGRPGCRASAAQLGFSVSHKHNPWLAVGPNTKMDLTLPDEFKSHLFIGPRH